MHFIEYNKELCVWKLSVAYCTKYIEKDRFLMFEYMSQGFYFSINIQKGKKIILLYKYYMTM